MSKPLNEAQKSYILTNRTKDVDLLSVESGAAKTTIEKFLKDNPSSIVPPPTENTNKTHRAQTFLAQQGKLENEKKSLKGVRVLTQAAAEQGDEARKKYNTNKISKRYAEAIIFIDPEASDNSNG